MLTVVKKHTGADFSARSVAFIDPEPVIVLPESGLLANLRLGRSLSLSLRNRAAGGANGTLAGATPPSGYTVGANSFTAATTGYLLLPVTMPVPATIISVYHQPASAPASIWCLGGAPRTSGDGLGLVLSAGGNIAALNRKNGASTSAALAMSGGNRYEFVAGVFDKPNEQLRVERPRTSSVVTQALLTANWASPTLNRILGNGNSDVGGAAEGALHILYSRALSNSEINSIYASAQASLVTAGISI